MTSKKYIIAYFPTSKEYFLIPSSWLIGDLDSENCGKCYFPPTNIAHQFTSDSKLKKGEVSVSWPTFEMMMKYSTGKCL